MSDLGANHFRLEENMPATRCYIRLLRNLSWDAIGEWLDSCRDSLLSPPIKRKWICQANFQAVTGWWLKVRLSSDVWVTSTSGLLWFLLFYLPTFMRRHKSRVCMCALCRKCALSALYMLMPEWRQTPTTHTTHYAHIRNVKLGTEKNIAEMSKLNNF